MMPSVRFCKAFLVFLICHAWLPSLVSSQAASSPATSSSSSSMSSAPVTMTTDAASSSSAMASATASAPVSASGASASSTSSSSPMVSTGMAPTTAASGSMAATSVSSLGNTSSPNNSSSSPGSYNSTISCRSFTCDGSNCYLMFMNTTAMACPSGCDYCEINESMYSVGCADSCDASRCVNTTQMDCVKDCCNATNCLNATLLAMEPTPEPTVPSTTQTMTTTTTSATTTMPSNGKKCKSLSCTGANCYTTTQAEMKWCYGTQTYCQLKKTADGSMAMWTAGCGADCTKQTACTASTPTCHQECCEASAAGDCLKLDGTLNMPNSGAGGSSRAMSSPLVLLGPCLVLWILAFMGELP